MSRHRKPKNGWIRCKYCGRIVYPEDKEHRNQKVHTKCVVGRPCDMIISRGKFHAEIHTELMTKAQLSRIMKLLPD